jgi:hypothetical protein
MFSYPHVNKNVNKYFWNKFGSSKLVPLLCVTIPKKETNIQKINNMAFISKKYYEELKKNKLIEYGDWVRLHRMSKEIGMKEGEGYVAATFRNAIVKQFTTTENIVQLIQKFYAAKSESMKGQLDAIEQMKEKFAV